MAVDAHRGFRPLPGSKMSAHGNLPPAVSSRKRTARAGVGHSRGSLGFIGFRNAPRGNASRPHAHMDDDMACELYMQTKISVQP